MNSKRSRAILWGSIIIAAVVIVCLILFLPGNLGKPAVYINEIMAENRSYPSREKQLCPWIELYNAGKSRRISAAGPSLMGAALLFSRRAALWTPELILFSPVGKMIRLFPFPPAAHWNFMILRASSLTLRR